MRAAKKTAIDRKLLQELVPLNALSAERFKEVSEKIVIEEVLAGRYLFRKGDRDNQSIYILEGKVNLIDGFRKVTSEVEAGTDISRYPIANQQPRSLSARAVKKVVIARVDSSLLDVFLTWDQSSTSEAVEIGSESNEDWMTRILQSEAFIKIPPAMIQGLLIKMETMPVKAGDTVIKQGDRGDYFYTIHEGRCAVTRREIPESDDKVLAELGEGDSFGEDALVSEAKRNATVTMLTDGLLMRLAKEDFVDLLKSQLVKHVGYDQAVTMVDEGAVWVDVRTPDEYQNSAFEDSVNLPLSSLRDELNELVFNSKYIICCDTSRRSESAGFLLSHKGFDVYVLEGGMAGLADVPEQPVSQAENRADDVESAEVIDISAGTNDQQDQSSAQPVASSDTAGNEQVAAHEALRASNESLAAQLESYRDTELRLYEQLDQLRGELGESSEKMAALYAQAKVDAEQLEVLRGELGESGEKLGAFYAKESTATDENRLLQEQYKWLQDEFSEKTSAFEKTIEQLQEQLSEQQGTAGKHEDEHKVLVEKLAEVTEAGKIATGDFESRLQQQTQEADSLKQDLGRIKRELAETQHELDNKAGLEEKVVRVNELESGNAELSEQVESLRESLQQQQSQLAEASAGQQVTAGSLQEMQSDNETLRTKLRDAGVVLDEYREQVENLDADKQAAEEVQRRQQSEWESERSESQQSLEREKQALLGLREELSHTESQASEERSALADELNEQLSRANEKIEQLEVKRVGLKQHQSAQADEIELAEVRHGALEQQLEEQTSLGSQLQAEIDTLKATAESQASDFEEQRGALQAQLDEARSQAGNIEQQAAESDAQKQQLQEQLERHQSEREALQLERDLLQQQQNELQLQLDQQHERVRSLEDENKASEKKAHEDLTRKNDNEKELQGQIDRLRKKMGQQTADYQNAHEDARSDVDRSREQLNDERRERDEERSEMAARQRELKEQLAVVATEHETNLTNQNGAIEKARDAARLEEQERLREILSTQEETENQVARLQKELKAAHDEVAELTRQEKDRRQVDVDLMEEQNQQAVTTISQLESQLSQLTEERDTVLDEQQALRSKMNALRGEVEVARGLMNAGGQVEDPARLRSALNESKKNIEIALRLRAEAETARDRLGEERDALQHQLEGGCVPQRKPDEGECEPLHVPSLDAGDPGAVHPGPGQQVQTAALPVRPVAREQDAVQAPLVDAAQDNKQRRWLGAAIGLGVVVLCALAGWFFLGKGVLPDNPGEVAVADVTMSDVVTSAELEQTAATVSETDAVVPRMVTEPDVASEAIPFIAPVAVTAGRTFQDSLKEGAAGPVMVELPAGNYQMGSAGNSLNYDEGPRHAVSIPAFSISQYEVTFSEYDRFARATGRRLPYDESWGRGDHPVVNVSWGDARAYTRWLSGQTGKTYRLPTEAEWEYATRAGTTTNHWWQDSSDNLHANCFNCGSEWDAARTAPVGSFKANDFGIYDVAGNVQEWTADCYQGSYQGASADGSAMSFSGCDMRVVRGGAYTSPLDSLRSAKRSQYNQETRLDNLGFRIVRAN